jgi:hypothetical protein
MPVTTWENCGVFSANSIGLHDLDERASPAAVLDDFRVRGRPFGPHPHAGFSALTYGPGGIVWFQAARGAMHREFPAEQGRELHGAQVFVKLGGKDKFIAPRQGNRR